MRVIGYVRVSTRDQEDSGLGLEAQRESLEQWCAAHDHELLTVTTDVVSGAKSDAMFGRQVAVAAVESGVAQGLLVRALDRVTRDQLDAAQIMKRANDYGWRLLDTEGADSGDPSQRLVADVRLAVAAEERRKIGTRTREALDAKRRKGEPGLIPTSTQRRIQVLAHQGLGAKAIATRLTTEGVPTATGGDTWSYSTVRRVLARLSQEVA
ncbi:MULTISPECIES: recombinase family protein [unclassified Gordonia (in: high G+C Gram-positive bacteria)]|uniref:recombinase family protein n=1 Tax=unclassified Gordonia (in: high G+C Gram-positive bacteria) TaxID=2657482 RepID=UPI000990F20F|nr:MULTISPECIES: recombinase family protein [unclassified Gordonia (in: high G+C Gram-positive bacteria)]MCX2756599.1 recombinase family protein [Gordonia sp. 4N]